MPSFENDLFFQLSSSLFCEIRDARSHRDILNPSTLNRVVENAVSCSSLAAKDPLADNVGFVLRPAEEDDDEENDKKTNSKNVFRDLRLGYRTEWPCNVILTEEVVDSYGEIFKFLLQLKKATWGLEQVYNSLKPLRKKPILFLHTLLIR